MGIQGLFRELEPQSRRIALTKYALDHYNATSRRLRIAIDASIWSFQVQGGKGGHNPALRTLYYRLVRLLSLNITPLFVFDGKKRPAFKRGRKTNVHLTPSLIQLCKKLLRMFGVPFHTAPGEAEAECALLQQKGIVDAVMSEDVDTLMFGATAVLRDWGPAAKGGPAKAPTHISVYEAGRIKDGAKLDRSGMVLIALMHGGDYLPEGLPGCGIKTAIEAAAAGFGEELCALVAGDDEGLREWRERLQGELTTNASKRFSKKNGRIKIPEEFPRRDLLEAYYTPIVSSPEDVETIRTKIDWDKDVDVIALREYARDTFEWRGTGGAAKFVRTLAPALVARWTLDGRHNISELVEGMHGVRTHISTDECVEIRIAYTPANVIHIDPEREAEDDELEASEQRGILDDDEGAIGERTPKGWVPDKPERIWVLEQHAKRTLSDHIDRWGNKRKPNSKEKASASTTVTTTKQQFTAARKLAGAEQTLDKYLTVLPGNIPLSRGVEAKGLVEGEVPTVEKRREPKKPEKSEKPTKSGGQNGNIRNMFTKVTKAAAFTGGAKVIEGSKPETFKEPTGSAHKGLQPCDIFSSKDEQSSLHQLEHAQKPSHPSSFISDRLSSRSISSYNDKLSPLQQHVSTAKSSERSNPVSLASNGDSAHDQPLLSDDELPSLHHLIASTPRKSKSSQTRPAQRPELPTLPSEPSDSDPDEPPIKARQRLMRRARKPAFVSTANEDSDEMDVSEIDLHRPFYEEVSRPSTPPQRTRKSHTVGTETESPTTGIRLGFCSIDLTEDSPEPAPPRSSLRSTRTLRGRRTVEMETTEIVEESIEYEEVWTVPSRSPSPSRKTGVAGVGSLTVTSTEMVRNEICMGTMKSTSKKTRIMVLDLTDEP